MATKSTPQSRWAKKMVKRGRCRACGAKRNKHKWLCDECGARFKQYMRDYRRAKKLALSTPPSTVPQEPANA